MNLYLTTTSLSYLDNNRLSFCALKLGLNKASMYTLRVDEFISTIHFPFGVPTLNATLVHFLRKLRDFSSILVFVAVLCKARPKTSTHS